MQLSVVEPVEVKAWIPFVRNEQLAHFLIQNETLSHANGCSFSSWCIVSEYIQQLSPSAVTTLALQLVGFKYLSTTITQGATSLKSAKSIYAKIYGSWWYINKMLSFFVRRMSLFKAFEYKIILITFNFRKWTKVETINTITDPIRDLAFSPNLGRSYHMLAIAAKEVSLLMIKPLTRLESC